MFQKSFFLFLKIQFLHLLLLNSLKPAEATDFFTYNDRYDEENYEYDYPEGEVHEFSEEVQTTFLPVFTSTPTVYRVSEGHTARLQCSVDRLGPMVLSWRRVDNSSTSGSSYLATGRLVMSPNKRISLLSSTTSSTLLITLVRPEDEGQYVCEVSSSPPVHMAHWLKLTAPPKVSILGKPKSGHFTVTENSELALVCLGSGEPRPQLSWSREGGLLPDGETSARGDQLIFSAVTRDHAGTFVCSGTTQTGAGARDSVSVTVHYAPLVTGWHSYTHNKRNVSLELVCSVTANPPAKVDWSRQAEKESNNDMDRFKVEYHKDQAARDRVKHILVIENPTQEDLDTVFICSARNKAGLTRKLIHVSGDSDTFSKTAKLKETKIASENQQKKFVASQDLQVVKNAEAARDDDDQVTDEDHKLLVAIAYNVRKVDQENDGIVKALKQNNRYLHSILRHMKALTAKEKTKIHQDEE